MPINHQTRKEYKPITGEELRVLYTAVLNDIQFIKKQQLEITNYVVGGFVAIVLFFNMVVEKIEFIPRLRFILGNILGLVSLIVMVLGICFIYRLEEDYRKSWDRKNRTIWGFTDGFRDILGFLYAPNQNTEKKPSSVVVFYIAAITLGEFLVLVFLFVR
jgi:hypothetical protein